MFHALWQHRLTVMIFQFPFLCANLSMMQWYIYFCSIWEQLVQLFKYFPQTLISVLFNLNIIN